MPLIFDQSQTFKRYTELSTIGQRLILWLLFMVALRYKFPSVFHGGAAAGSGVVLGILFLRLYSALSRIRSTYLVDDTGIAISLDQRLNPDYKLKWTDCTLLSVHKIVWRQLPALKLQMKLPIGSIILCPEPGTVRIEDVEAAIQRHLNAANSM